MKEVLFISGGNSYSNRNDFLLALKQNEIRNPTGEDTDRWTKHLRGELGSEYQLFAVDMPNGENAHYDEWAIWFGRHVELLTGPVVLIGWSLGGMFLLKYLSQNDLSVMVSGLVVLGAPAGHCDDGSGNDCGTFQFEPKELKDLDKKIPNLYILHSKDDFVVPYDNALTLKKVLPKANLVTFEDRNHFLQTDFPELTEIVKQLTN